MITCDACRIEFPGFMFEKAEGGTMYPHLHLRNVCKTCQLNPRECTMCHVEYPPTHRYFYRKERGKHGKNSRCIPCVNSINLDRHHDPAFHEHNLERMRRYRKEKCPA